MTKTKKSILITLLGVVALFASIFALFFPKMNKTVSASAESTYTTVDVPVFVKIGQEYALNGNFNLWISLPQVDVELNGQTKSVMDENLSNKFNELNFFDNILVGEKSLKELGCTGFWTEEVVFGDGEPKNVIRLKCHADPALWNAAISNGEVEFVGADMKKEMTVKKGALIPGYTYLTGEENPIVYRASIDCVARIPNPDVSYSRVIYGQTDIDSVQFTRVWNAEEGNAYLGVSFEGDDYLGDGAQDLLFQDSKHALSANPKFFLNNILVNGQKATVDYYGFFNLDEKGKGYYSFVFKTPTEAGDTITIPEGTIFPMRAINDFQKVTAPHTVFMFYETKSEQTFYLADDGAFYNYVDYVVRQLESYHAEDGYYREVEAAQRAQIVETAKAAILSASNTEEIAILFANAKAEIDVLKTAAQYADEELATVKASGREDIQNHLKGTVYLAEQAEERAQVIEAGFAGITAAKSEEEIAAAVTMAKTALDAITPKQVFVDAALADLTAYKADATYYDAQKAEKDAVISAATTAIQNATSKADLDKELVAAKAKIDEIPTTADLLEGYKQEALNKINEKKALVNYGEYLEASHAAINELYFNAKKAVQSATSETEVDKAVAAFEQSLDAIPKIPQQEGCGSTLGIGAIFGVLTIMGGAILLKKDKDE